MKLSAISRRFLFSRKSHSLVNLVAVVSIVAILVPTAAMVVVMSLQNGLSGMVHNLYADFDSELKIVPRSGQYFEVSEDELYDLREFADVSEVLETSAVAEYNDSRILVTLKGVVDSTYSAVSKLPSIIKRGGWQLRHGDLPRAVMGAGASYDLAYTLGGNKPITISAMVPVPSIGGMIGGGPVLSSESLVVAGIFSIEAQIDSRYLFTDLDFVRELLGKDSEVTSLELKSRVSEREARKRIADIIEEDVVVLNRFEQRSTIFSAIEAERVVIFCVLLFVGLIAAMSLAGCSLMMTAEKASSAVVLRSLGMSERRVRRVFLMLGMRVVILGVGIGLVFGSALVLMQEHFEVLTTGGDGMVVDNYPVELHLSDIAFTAFSMCAIGYLIIWLTIGRMRFSTEV